MSVLTTGSESIKEVRGQGLGRLIHIDIEITGIYDCGCVGDCVSVAGAKVSTSCGRVTQGLAVNNMQQQLVAESGFTAE